MSDSLARLTAALADRYRIERELGAGGMATVYLAQDLKHDRKVAIKVLRPELAAVIGADRFLREIKTIAALQHPHILGLIDSGTARVQSLESGAENASGQALDSGLSTLVYYVMPYVDGESLRDRLNREKQLSINDAVRLATEIAGALDYAHRHNVIHRDIKPENILLHDGRALVADFGIALAVSSAGGSRMTETGMSLGTPHYMSPEQAMGEREITARSDVYALGCVTYEMLTGDPPFTGSTAQAIVAKMMTEKPTPPSRVRDTVPEQVEDAVLTALAKLPADRWRSAAEFAETLAGGGRSGSGRIYAARTAAARPSVRPSALYAAIAAALLLAVWGWLRPQPATTTGVVRFEMAPPAGVRIAYPIGGINTYLAIAPDGRQVVFAAGRGPGQWSLYLRDLDQLVARVLPGSEGGMVPAFSPDGKWIAFASPDGSLKKIGLDGTALTTLARMDLGVIGGITWSSNREIVFTRETYVGRGLWRVSADGGAPDRFSQFDTVSSERLQLSPVASPDGRLIFYSGAVASTIDLRLGVVEMATGKPTVFRDIRGAATVIGLVEGYLVYIRIDGTLMAAPFDQRSLKLGPPLQILDSVATRGWQSAAVMSATGTLFYQRGGLASRLVRVDPSGVEHSLLDSARVYTHPRLSPDGKRVAFESQEGADNQIWIADLAAQTAQRLTREGFNDRPEWSPDGRRLMYVSSRTADNSIWWQSTDGSGSAELLFKGPDAIREAVFTPDGSEVVYRSDTPDSTRDIYRLPLGGERKPIPLLVSIDDDKEPRVSPDGHWLVYVSNASGREEVYVRPLAGAGGRLAVSNGGGGEPLWSPDGKRVYYRIGGRLLAAGITTSPALAVNSRDTLFEGPYLTDLYHPNYDVAPDGRSFIMVRPVEATRQLVVVVNWLEELRRRTAGKQ
ncbi:MAG: protein kinase [Gemmatimonadota bacterium]